MLCNKCGNQVPDNVKFCTSCGAAMTGEAPVTEATTATVPPPPVTPMQPTQPQADVYKEEPISTMGYFGIMFLLMIPALNLLLLIIWACGGCRKRNKRNFARATLLWFVIGGILSALIVLVGGLLFSDEFNTLKESIMQIHNS